MLRPGTLAAAQGLIREAVDRRLLLAAFGMLVLVTLSGALAAGSPLALKHLVDAVASTDPADQPAGNAMLLAGAIYLMALAGGRLMADVRPLLAGTMEQRVLAHIRQRFFAHVLRLPTAYLVNRRGGELLHSADLAAAGAQAIMSHVANGIAPALIELVLMSVVLGQLQQPGLVVLFVTTSLLYLAVFAVGLLRQQPAIREVSSGSLEVHGQLSDGIAHVETLRCFGAVNEAEQSLGRASSLLASRWLRFHRLTVQGALAASAVFAVTLAACLVLAAEAVARGQLSVGGFVLASVYMLQLVRPLETLGMAARDLARAIGFMRPLLDILAEPSEAWTEPDARAASRWTPPASSPSLHFEDLYFGYDTQRPVIRGLDLQIAAGRTTAIVGRSGSGKSSLVRLLLRLHEPQAGRILVDGHPIESIPTADLRAMIGLVPQDAGLLQASVRSNIALGLPGATQQSIEHAATRAQLHQLVGEMLHGYDTLLGERGQTLSGGERQRLAIARAMLRKPMIYLLDEPTSMLDGKTEAAILPALQELTFGCTTLVIAHRLSTIMHADHIVVLEGGQVHEQGRHAELLAKQGLYAQLWRQQTGSQV